ncbi:hypothetical protein J4E91_002428 [Alternaria rosae]|nr:hypothetical protein J4E91_002428 [Alternaria rosae]
MDVFSSIIYTHNWTTVAKQCCSLLRLSTESWELLHDAAFATYVLVETCDSQCTDVCASHAIIGFAGVLRSGGHEHQNTKPMVPTELRPSTDDASSGMLKLKRDAQQRIEELLRVGNKKARATQYKPNHYRLEMNLEFMVQLSIFMVRVEEGDWWALFQDPAELGEALQGIDDNDDVVKEM